MFNDTAPQIAGGIIILGIAAILIALLLPAVDPWLAEWHSFITNTPIADACLATPDAEGCGGFRIWRIPAWIALIGLALAALAQAWP